mmetsp:Transcript_5432/g.15763  ORF Transcript_5432/g.15763 Transcript_5432/m.15763 type:complete len:203 (+) Transcript_5432:471-1079(+)
MFRVSRLQQVGIIDTHAVFQSIEVVKTAVGVGTARIQAGSVAHPGRVRNARNHCKGPTREATAGTRRIGAKDVLQENAGNRSGRRSRTRGPVGVGGCWAGASRSVESQDVVVPAAPVRHDGFVLRRGCSIPAASGGGDAPFAVPAIVVVVTGFLVQGDFVPVVVVGWHGCHFGGVGRIHRRIRRSEQRLEIGVEFHVSSSNY